jgi:hypothetical protein
MVTKMNDGRGINRLRLPTALTIVMLLFLGLPACQSIIMDEAFQQMKNHPIRISRGPCDGLRSVLVVETGSRSMLLCEGRKVFKKYSVSIGRGGVEKRKQGDKKTPIGEYALGSPRLSRKFGIFIPVEYPTNEQRLNGFSGGAIGIHGPKRDFRWMGDISTLINWTSGCIAVGTDAEIAEVSQWVEEEEVNKIIIR